MDGVEGFEKYKERIRPNPYGCPNANDGEFKCTEEIRKYEAHNSKKKK